MSHVHAFSCIRTFNSLYSLMLFCWCFSDCLSLPLSPSCVSLLYGTQAQIYSVLEPSAFWGIFFFWLCSFLRMVSWWLSLKELFEELFLTRHSFGMPSHSFRFFRYWPSYCHLQLRFMVTVWHPGHLSLCDCTGVLLQYVRIWYFCTSFLLSRA